jgi:hypothetical protein
MPPVDVAALGTARKMHGFSRRTLSVDQGTVADLLRSLDTVEGRNLYVNLTSEGRLRGDFAVLVDGLSLKPDQLDRPLSGGEQIVTLAILRHLHGG